MSRSAELINEALKLYRECLGTDAEQAAYEHLNSVVARAKRTDDDCCGGRCRWCPVWREKQ